MKVFVTYGLGTDRKRCYSVVDAVDYPTARRMIEAACGHNFAFDYDDEKDFARQIKEYGLREVPIGPATMKED